MVNNRRFLWSPWDRLTGRHHIERCGGSWTDRAVLRGQRTPRGFVMSHSDAGNDNPPLRSCLNIGLILCLFCFHLLWVMRLVLQGCRIFVLAIILYILDITIHTLLWNCNMYRDYGIWKYIGYILCRLLGMIGSCLHSEPPLGARGFGCGPACVGGRVRSGTFVHHLAF